MNKRYADEVVILKLEESENDDEEAYVSVDDEAVLPAIGIIVRIVYMIVWYFTGL